MVFRSIVAMSLFIAVNNVISIGAVPAPLSTPIPCAILPAGNYAIQSVTIFPGIPLSIGSASTFGNVIIQENNTSAPGVWHIIPADQGGYHILNVGVARNVTTVNLVESGLFLPVIGLTNTAATTYAIECAGGAEYVIKNVVADQLWTPVSSANPQVSTIALLPSTGSRSAHWNFVPA
ncbi:hypothetical protein HYPSUDRAFT_68217 [Hypholoma sublateritium FD-334 SS-4]|uniref:Carbohydrate-binding module family 13 protein n=1 Tax=Hypholoma sublateritium (strain FD-334 SS-4) TaxID=945553 RepID=A0A0D2NQ52_HYPSF|nr:hypothetical protein HYPSUDRAFT_68217 [Hypholoma sublateritium FD-334 SS-4]